MLFRSVIADRYRSLEFEKEDGEAVTGMIVKENDETVTIQSGPSDALIQAVKKSDLKSRRLQAASLMPLGLLNALTKEQILDLMAFVEAGGKVPPHSHPP